MRIALVLLIVCASSFALPAFAEVAKLDLSEALDRAMQGNGDLRSQRLQIDQATTEISRVSGEFGPHLEGLAGIGPITKAEGDANYAKEDHNTWGRTLYGKISLTEPLYTWGRKSDYERAAESGVRVKEGDLQLKELQIRYEVKEAYFGYQLANSLRDFVAGGKAELTKSLEQRKKKKKPAKEEYRLEIFMQEVASKEAEINKYFEIAKEGFTLRIGMPRGSALPKEEWLLPKQRERKPVEYYVNLAKQHRPEFRQVKEGISAKRNLAKAEKKGLIPIIGLFASYEAVHTNVRNIQPSVFSYDPFNHKAATAGVGFKWDFQWELQRAKAAKANAEAEELELKEEYANQGIETEVRKTYFELIEAQERAKAATESNKIGKKWLTGEAIGYGSGLGNSQSLVEAYGARAETTKTYFEAIYREHMAWAALSKVVGVEVDPTLPSSL